MESIDSNAKALIFTKFDSESNQLPEYVNKEITGAQVTAAVVVLVI